MKLYRNFLMSTAVIATILPVTLVAETPDGFEDNVRAIRRAPASQPDVEISQGWFSSYRKTAGAGVCWIGEQISTSDDTQTREGQLKASLKNMAYNYVINTFGLSGYESFLDKKTVFTAVGNVVRKLGDYIKGTTEAQPMKQANVSLPAPVVQPSQSSLPTQLVQQKAAPKPTPLKGKVNAGQKAKITAANKAKALAAATKAQTLKLKKAQANRAATLRAKIAAAKKAKVLALRKRAK